MTDLAVTVKSIKGYCYAGLQAGQKFIFRDPVVAPEGNAPLCLYALSSMFPYLTAACRQTPAEDWINAVEELQCPDSKNTVIFSVQRRVSQD